MYMTTTKKRINVSISKELDEALLKLAKRDQVPQATKAEEMIRLGVELEEDILLGELAGERYKTAKKSFSHRDVWEK